MEQLAVTAFNPHLKRVLKSFQSAAMNSLSGPQNYVAAWGDPAKLSPGELEEYRKALLAATIPGLTTLKKEITETPLVFTTVASQIPAPLLLPMDNSRVEKTDTMLEGETIACFIVGGEKRLCLPQILNTVLRHFVLDDINNVCDDLHIFCSRCNAGQLHILKQQGILPQGAPSCGLITKTDAERLCNALLHRNPEKAKEPPSPSSFRVYHECFGKCKGIFSPEKYNTPFDKCIECVDCHGMFSPQKFVCHSHKALENRTCHWGFDSANWRSYLLLSKDQECREQCQEFLDRMKARFDYSNRFKRKESPESDKEDGTKRGRYNDENSPPSASWDSRQMSAFRPWSPGMLKDAKFREGLQPLPAYLQTGPPVLLHPERVIPHSESNRYERHFAPNVSLAPVQKKEGEEDELENLKSRMPQAYKPHSVGIPPVAHSTSVEDNLDIDVLSDTESSLKSSDSSVPSTPRDDSRTSLLSPLDLSSDREAMLDMVQRAIDGKVECKESFLEEFIQTCNRREEKLQHVIKVNKELQQELEYVKVTKRERLREASEAKKGLRREVERVKDEHSHRLRQLTDERDRLQRHVDIAQNSSPDVSKVKAKYKAQVDHLRGQLASVEHSNAQLSKEVAALTAELSKLRCSPEGSTQKLNGVTDTGVVIKKERRDSTDTDASQDGSTSTASEGAEPSGASGESGKSSDPAPIATS